MVGKVLASTGYMDIFMGIYNSMSPIKDNEVAVEKATTCRYTKIHKKFTMRIYEIMQTNATVKSYVKRLRLFSANVLLCVIDTKARCRVGGIGHSEQQSLQPYSVLFLSGQIWHCDALVPFEGKWRPCRQQAGGGWLISWHFLELW